MPCCTPLKPIPINFTLHSNNLSISSLVKYGLALELKYSSLPYPILNITKEFFLIDILSNISISIISRFLTSIISTSIFAGNSILDRL